MVKLSRVSSWQPWRRETSSLRKTRSWSWRLSVQVRQGWVYRRGETRLSVCTGGTGLNVDVRQGWLYRQDKIESTGRTRLSVQVRQGLCETRLSVKVRQGLRVQVSTVEWLIIQVRQYKKNNVYTATETRTRLRQGTILHLLGKGNAIYSTIDLCIIFHSRSIGQQRGWIQVCKNSKHRWCIKTFLTYMHESGQQPIFVAYIFLHFLNPSCLLLISTRD